MGSVGQYEGETSFIRDVLIENVWLLNGEQGARLKTWAGEHVGRGFIDNITFRNFWQANNQYAAFLDSCYFNIDEDTCARFPSGMNVTNVLFENFEGYTSGASGSVVAKLTCSKNPSAVCENIRFRNFNISTPCGGPPVILCDGISDGVGLPCVGAKSEEGRAALSRKCSIPNVAIDPPFKVGSF